MADNAIQYGFRWAKGFNGGKSCPQPQMMAVADAYQAQDDASGFNVNLNAGDPVKLVSDGTVALANTTDVVWGVVAGVDQYFDGTRITPNTHLPGGATGGGLFERQSQLLVYPARGCAWAVQVDDNTTATTQSAYQAFLGENVEHVCAGTSATSEANPQLDISGHATTATFGWRLVAIDPTLANQDFTGANVSLIVEINESSGGGAPATPIVGT